MSRSWLRGNAFLVAAISLPVVVVLLFLAATAVPAWLVGPPTHDLLLRVPGPRGPAEPPYEVTFAVRDERVEATFRRVPASEYPPREVLFLVDHETLTAREVPVEMPSEVAEDGRPRTVVVAALAGRTVLAQTTAPDGYVFEYLTRRGPGIVGEIFGMRGYDQAGALVKRGRVVRIELPSTYGYQTAYALGWIPSDEDR